MDFEGSAPQVKASLNSTLSFTKSNAYAAMRTLLRSDIPEQRRLLPADHGYGAARQHRQLRPPGGDGHPRADRLPRPRRGLRGAGRGRSRIGSPGASDGGLSLVTIGGVRPGGERFSVVELLSGAWGGQADHEGQDGVPNLGANVSNIPVEMLEAAVPGAGRSLRLRARHRRRGPASRRAVARARVHVPWRGRAQRAGRPRADPAVRDRRRASPERRRATPSRRAARSGRCHRSSRGRSSPATGSTTGPPGRVAWATRSTVSPRRSPRTSGTRS